MFDAYFVYIVQSTSRRTLYIGFTKCLVSRVIEHRARIHPKIFTAKYRTWRLVYYEEFGDSAAAFTRERQLKGWSPSKEGSTNHAHESTLARPGFSLGRKIWPRVPPRRANDRQTRPRRMGHRSFEASPRFTRCQSGSSRGSAVRIISGSGWIGCRQQQPQNKRSFGSGFLRWRKRAGALLRSGCLSQVVTASVGQNHEQPEASNPATLPHAAEHPERRRDPGAVQPGGRRSRRILCFAYSVILKRRGPMTHCRQPVLL